MESNDATIKVQRRSYSWGELLTIFKGNSWTVVLHPEAQERVRALKVGDEAHVLTEDGTLWEILRLSNSLLFTPRDRCRRYFLLNGDLVAEAGL